MSGETNISLVEVDFVVVKEDYSRYLVEDGTVIRAKLVVRRIFKAPVTTPQGYPAQISLDSVNTVAAMVPDRLKRPPSKDPFDITREAGKEMKFDLMGEQRWQEYITPDGLRVLVRPVVTKVIKYEKFNAFGEPVYNVIMQAITNVEKISGTA